MGDAVTIDPVGDVSPPFNARYRGRCSLDTCEKGGDIEQGDVVQYLHDTLMHMTCARRIVRQQSAPLCSTCWCYHQGECA